MRILSLFDGISCGRVAFERVGIPVDVYYASEIDKYAISVAQAIYPDTKQIGNVCEVDFSEYKNKVDIIIGGSPCLDLSITKQNRQGLRGEQSKLFWEYIRALETIRPKYFLLENVASMRNEDKEAITETLKKIYPETECVMINSDLVSAQQRKRLYWTNWHVEQPEDRGILLKDVLENNAVIDREKSRAVIGSIGRTTEREYFRKTQGQMVFEPIRVGTLPNLGKGQANRIYSIEGKSVCLNANGGGGGAKTGLYMVDLPDGNYTIRKLTPRECCRLQTYPERVFDVAKISDTHNIISVSVMVGRLT